MYIQIFRFFRDYGRKDEEKTNGQTPPEKSPRNIVLVSLDSLSLLIVLITALQRARMPRILAMKDLTQKYIHKERAGENFNGKTKGLMLKIIYIRFLAFYELIKNIRSFVFIIQMTFGFRTKIKNIQNTKNIARPKTTKNIARPKTTKNIARPKKTPKIITGSIYRPSLYTPTVSLACK